MIPFDLWLTNFIFCYIIGMSFRKSLLPAPLSFARVEDGIYRSAYPTQKSLEFISQLKLKSMVCLNPSDIRQELRNYAESRSISLVECNVGCNQEPFLSMSVEAMSDAVTFISDASNHPVLVFCTNGKLKTSCVIGCLRKLHHQWRLSSIFHEYEMFTDPDGGLADLVFIENFT